MDIVVSTIEVRGKRVCHELWLMKKSKNNNEARAIDEHASSKGKTYLSDDFHHQFPPGRTILLLLPDSSLCIIHLIFYYPHSIASNYSAPPIHSRCLHPFQLKPHIISKP